MPNAKNVAYEAIARGAGYPRACAFDSLETTARVLPEVLNGPGPVFVALKVHPDVQNRPIGQRDKSWMARTRIQVLRDLGRELGIGA